MDFYIVVFKLATVTFILRRHERESLWTVGPGSEYYTVSNVLFIQAFSILVHTQV